VLGNSTTKISIGNKCKPNSLSQMAMEPSVDAKNTENNSSEFAVNGHPDQNDSSDSDLSNIDDGDNSKDEDGSTDTISSYHVNDFQRLALACDDGSVRLYNVHESGALTYYRSLPRVSGMCYINSFFCYFDNKFNTDSYVCVFCIVTFVCSHRADSSYDFGVFYLILSIWEVRVTCLGIWLLVSSSYFSARQFYCNWMLLLPFHFIGDGATLESVPDLVKAMYLNVESFPCVRLLNLSGEIGCSSESALYMYLVFHLLPLLKLTSPCH
jgi:hypothetical protein